MREKNCDLIIAVHNIVEAFLMKKGYVFLNLVFTGSLIATVLPGVYTEGPIQQWPVINVTHLK